MRPERKPTRKTSDEPAAPEGWLVTSTVEKPRQLSAHPIAGETQISFIQDEAKSSWSLTAETKNLFYKLKHGFLSTVRSPEFSHSMHPLVLLGVAYVPTGSDAPKNVGETIKAGPEYLRTHFQRRFSSLFWMTYRSNFRELRTAEGAEIDSDAGWGCTLRVGQMMLLETLGRAKHSYGRSDERALLRMMLENRVDAEFSLHSLLRTAAAMKKYPGDWFSPMSVAYLLQQHTSLHPLDQIRIILQVDGTVSLDQLAAAATGLSVERARTFCYCAQHQKLQKPKEAREDGLFGSYLSDLSNSADEYEDFEPVHKCDFCGKDVGPAWQASLLVLVPLMLGLGEIAEEYYAGVKMLLNFPQSVGLIGGRPRSAFYIVGHQANNLVYLDPHYVQPACSRFEDFSCESFHCEQASLLPLAEAESSIAAGFFLQDESDYRDFIRRCERSSLKDIVHLQMVSRPMNEIEDSTNCLFFDSPDLDYLQV